MSAAEFPAGLFPSTFRPVWWLRNPHAQTLFSTFFRRPPALERQRETVELQDGDFLDLDWHFPAGWTPQRPLVLAVHGLSGSSDSHYVRGLQAELGARGWASAALNCRGASRPNNLPRAYHAGASDDVRHALEHMRARFPEAPRAVVGYSLGGNMTLKLMGELAAEGNDDLVFAATAVSPPLVLALCADRMDLGVSVIYRRHFITELVAHWEEKLAHLERAGHLEAVTRVRERLLKGPFESFWHFDNELVAPLHGFDDVHDYYERSSGRQFLPAIRVPTLVIHSRDDPLMSPAVMPEAEELAAAVRFELCAKGGHVGFIEGGLPWRPAYYLEHRIPDFLEGVLAGRLA